MSFCFQTQAVALQRSDSSICNAYSEISASEGKLPSESVLPVEFCDAHVAVERGRQECMSAAEHDQWVLREFLVCELPVFSEHDHVHILEGMTRYTKLSTFEGRLTIFLTLGPACTRQNSGEGHSSPQRDGQRQPHASILLQR